MISNGKTKEEIEERNLTNRESKIVIRNREWLLFDSSRGDYDGNCSRRHYRRIESIEISDLPLSVRITDSLTASSISHTRQPICACEAVIGRHPALSPRKDKL